MRKVQTIIVIADLLFALVASAEDEQTAKVAENGEKQ